MILDTIYKAHASHPYTTCPELVSGLASHSSRNANLTMKKHPWKTNHQINHSTWRYGRKNAGERGKFSIFEAKLKAESEYEKFRVVQDKLFESDFDRFLKQLKEKTKE